MGYKKYLLCILYLFVSRSFIGCQQPDATTNSFLKRYEDVVKSIYKEACSSYKDGEEFIKKQSISFLIDVYKKVLCDVESVKVPLTSTEEGEECQVCRKEDSGAFSHIFFLKHCIGVTGETKCLKCGETPSNEEGTSFSKEDINKKYEEKIKEVVSQVEEQNKKNKNQKKQTFVQDEKKYEIIFTALLKAIPNLTLESNWPGRQCITYCESLKEDQRISDSEDRSIFIGKIENLKLHNHAAILLSKLQISEDNDIDYMEISCNDKKQVSEFAGHNKNQSISVGKIKILVLDKYAAVLLLKLRISDDNQLTLLKLISNFDITDFVKDNMQTVPIKGVEKLELRGFASIAITKFDKDFNFSSGTVLCDDQNQIAWMNNLEKGSIIAGSVGEQFIERVNFENYKKESKFTIDLKRLSKRNDSIKEEKEEGNKEGKKEEEGNKEGNKEEEGNNEGKKEEEGKGLSTGKIALIVVGSILGSLFLVGCAFFYFTRTARARSSDI